ncbi:MAG: hypothetical protein COR54_00865 [Elusimicrobia bacterium CG22_combo_CG10-13_8_21_14_all_63_91]|nr:MAG: hypothetical protein COR54_00865 [Elusimicrobia bacterium CG22_combo_CG10-13_8_21_14_all_63_91]
MMVNDYNYETVTGRQIDLRSLTADEKDCLTFVLSKYKEKPGWSEFAAWWFNYVDDRRIGSDSPVQRICSDLEARIGIAEGKVKPPDYQDYLAAFIDEQYGSRYKFCQATGVDQGQLSKVISGKADLSLDLLRKVLSHLHASLIIQREETARSAASPEEASRVLAALAR